VFILRKEVSPSARAVVRSVATAVGLLVAPAPEIIFRMAFSPEQAARFVVCFHLCACDRFVKPKRKLLLTINESLEREKIYNSIVRQAVDYLGLDDTDWYRARDDLEMNLSPLNAKAVHFLSEFPGMTALSAEKIVVTEQIAPSQLLLSSDAEQFASAYTGPEINDPYAHLNSRRLALKSPESGMKKVRFFLNGR